MIDQLNVAKSCNKDDQVGTDEGESNDEEEESEDDNGDDDQNDALSISTDARNNTHTDFDQMHLQ